MQFRWARCAWITTFLAPVLVAALTSPAISEEFDALIARTERVDSARSQAAWDDAALEREVSDGAIDHRRQMVIRFAPTDPYWYTERKWEGSEDVLGDVYVAILPLQEGARWERSRHPGYVRLAMTGFSISTTAGLVSRSTGAATGRFTRAR